MPPFNTKQAAVSVVLLCSFIFAVGGVACADALNDSRKVISKTNKTLNKSQDKINALDDKTATMLDQYKTAYRESQTYTTYNQQLREIVSSQQEELLSLDKQIEEIEVTSTRIMPLMARMIDALEEFIAQDLPFLPSERSNRVAALRDNMIRADLTVAEKYRKILEAYQIEIEYGRTLEAYEGEIEGKQVNFLKVGRTAFFYQTLDQLSSAIWNKHSGEWDIVEDKDVKHSVGVAMKIARKQRSPELLSILASKVETAQ